MFRRSMYNHMHMRNFNFIVASAIFNNYNNRNNFKPKGIILMFRRSMYNQLNNSSCAGPMVSHEINNSHVRLKEDGKK